MIANDRIYPVDGKLAKSAWINNDTYLEMYEESITDPDGFWMREGKRIDWIKPYSRIKNVCYDYPAISIKWFEDGVLNACVNCVDRHLEKYADKTAIIREGDEPGNNEKITYRQLHKHVCRLANVMKAHEVKRGDRVTIYMPMTPEAAYAMLACARIGAVHSVVFGGFSPDALAGRILDCGSDFIITADRGVRGGKHIPLKSNVDKAIKIAERKGQTVRNVLVTGRTGVGTSWTEGRDIDYDATVNLASDYCPAEEMNAEDPLFILYTSGSTGKPKGLVHTTGGYMVWASFTHQYVFDYHDEDIYWCAADVGWVTGHSYVVYGPLANGATTLMFEGVPNYPTPARFWQVCDEHQVTLFYTAPTVIRALMQYGVTPVESTSRRSLRLLASVGEPINPEAWEWYYNVIGEKRCPVIDTWWQTETGGIMISPLPGATPLKPGSATQPLPGVKPQLVNEKGEILEGEASGNLCMAESWPGQARTIYGDHERFMKTYFSVCKGKYFTGDGCERDKDGYYWITGRIDDVINVSGHRMGTAEIESALVAHEAVSEAAVVGYPHHIKGQGIYCYVTLMKEVRPNDNLKKNLIEWIRHEIGPIASPDEIQWAPELPKTRSGKIIRRILRKIAADDFSSLGDTSTLAEPAVVDSLIKNRHTGTNNSN